MATYKSPTAHMHGNSGIYGNSSMYDNSVMYGNSSMHGNSSLHNNSSMRGNSVMYGNSSMRDNSIMHDNSSMYDNSIMRGNSGMYGNSSMRGNSQIINTALYGCADIRGDGLLKSRTDYIVLGPAKSSERFTTAHKDSLIGIRVNTGCFSGSLDEFIAAIQETHANNPSVFKQYMGFVACIKAHFELE